MKTKMAILIIFLATSAHAAEKPSRAFLKKAIEGNFAEIEMGKLAQQNGRSEDVKKFGQMLIDDHSAANQKAIDAAHTTDVTLPNGANAKQRAVLDKMSKVSGARFDSRFYQVMVA